MPRDKAAIYTGGRRDSNPRPLEPQSNALSKLSYIHGEIMRAPKGSFVDHIDHNTLNNRRCNLRECTLRQNEANKGPHGGVSGLVGVYPRGKRWEAGITWRGKHYYLGKSDDPAEAAKAQDRKAYELHGQYAYLNFPEDIAK